MTKIMRPEQAAKQLNFPDPVKFRREFGDLVTVISGQELIDLELAEARLNALVNPESDIGLDHRRKSSRKTSGENVGQVKSQILRLQKSIRKLEPEVTEARDLYEKTGKPADKLEYLQINDTLMNKEKSLLKAQHEYDRIIRERIEEIEGSASKEEK
jgi:hypothetical protein